MDHPPPTPASKFPLLVTVIIAVLLGLGLFYLAMGSREKYRNRTTQLTKETDLGKKATGQPAIKVYLKKGAEKYAVCASCHGGSGEGSAIAPELSDIDWLTTERIIAILTRGVKGPIEVNDKIWHSIMPGIAVNYSPFELASLATYLQHQHGLQKDKIVSIEQVEEIIGNLKENGIFNAEQIQQQKKPTSKPLSLKQLVDSKTGKPIENQ